MSIIFFKTKGKDFCGVTVTTLSLGLSATATAALPGIVPLPSCEQTGAMFPDGTKELPPPPGDDGNKTERGSSLVSPLLLLLLSGLFVYIDGFGCENNTTQTPCSPYPLSALVGYS